MKNCWSGVNPSMVGAGGLPLQRFFERQISDFGARQIANRFSEHQLAVVVDAWLDEVAVELIGDALGALLEILQVAAVHQLLRRP